MCEKLGRLETQILRIKNNILCKITNKTLPQDIIDLTRFRLKASEIEILRLNQKESLLKELNQLGKYKQLTKHSKMRSSKLNLENDKLMEELLNPGTFSSIIFFRLPSQRLLAGEKPFRKLGVNYFGPFKEVVKTYTK